MSADVPDRSGGGMALFANTGFLFTDVRSRGIPIILISHNMPHVFEVAGKGANLLTLSSTGSTRTLIVEALIVGLDCAAIAYGLE